MNLASTFANVEPPKTEELKLGDISDGKITKKMPSLDQEVASCNLTNLNTAFLTMARTMQAKKTQSPEQIDTNPTSSVSELAVTEVKDSLFVDSEE